VLRAAAQQIRAWQQQGLYLSAQRLAVNVSPRQFRQSDFVERVTNIFEEEGVPLDCLELEITETLVMENVEDAIEKMTVLRASGISFSINGDDIAIIETIIAMTNHLGVGVIAEGVETREQPDFLREKGCTAFQGFYFSRAVAAEEFARFFRSPVGSPHPE
jgi:EAL domain-containing protein (putative c-di-GMP-specific phosphodiesterase class I)